MPGSTDPLLLVIAAALFAASAAAALAAWQILGRIKAAEKHLECLRDLAPLRERVERLASQQPELDLRRLSLADRHPLLEPLQEQLVIRRADLEPSATAVRFLAGWLLKQQTSLGSGGEDAPTT